jgi:hypothetical protein
MAPPILDGGLNQEPVMTLSIPTSLIACVSAVASVALTSTAAEAASVHRPVAVAHQHRIAVTVPVRRAARYAVTPAFAGFLTAFFGNDKLRNDDNRRGGASVESPT